MKLQRTAPIWAMLLVFIALAVAALCYRKASCDAILRDARTASDSLAVRMQCELGALGTTQTILVR